MKRFPAGRRGDRGVVLIIVLALVLLITGLILAYLSRSGMERVLSNSSVNQSKADELARSALDIITGDLKQEIVSGSTVVAPYSTPGSSHYSPIYQPSNNAYVIPTQHWPGESASGAGAVPNLIRISTDAATMAAIPFPAIDHAASASLTTAPSLNGRSVSLARWNQHYLIPRATGATDSSPTGSFTAPSWVYVQPSGPAVITAPTGAVIGRYAYAVYNEGGLLDVNTAGFPSTSTLAQYGGKGASLGYADLTQLQNSSGTSLLTSAQVDQIVGWRNYASVQPSGSLPNFTMNAANAQSYLNFLTTSTNSFLKVSYNTYNSKTDQAFLSRQELLNLQSSIGFSADALQYLGTFSREVNAPTFFYPAAYSTSYPSPDPIANTTNLNILSLRMAQAGASPDGFAWNAGDPLVARRFPLGRLAWLTYKGPSADLSPSDPLYNAAGTDANIQAFFGLQWIPLSSTTNDHWNYVGPSGSTVQASIETLSQVVAETTSREPNFFELLKAAIHQDSLGVTDGFYNKSNNNNTLAGNADLSDGLNDLQILRIGANMVDQADADSYPTILEYNPTGSTPLYAYGIEDLPYVNALGFRSVADSYWNNNFVDPGSAGRVLRDQLVPVLWDPHRTINTSNGPVPSKIQLYMVGKTYYILCGSVRGSIGGNVAGCTAPTYNDTTAYGAATNQGRYNEIALTSSSLTGPSNEQNTGSIIIDTTKFPLSNFANPSLIPVTTGITATGAFATTSATAGTFAPGLPNHTTGELWGSSATIYGLTLQNNVYAQARPAIATDYLAPGVNASFPSGLTVFDGYTSSPLTSPVSNQFKVGTAHHTLDLGVGGAGVNVVLRYLDPNDPTGNTWQIYSVLCGNEADPNGNLYTNYDTFGMVDTTTSTTAGVSTITMFGTNVFPPERQTVTAFDPTSHAPTTGFPDPNWASSGGALAASINSADENGKNGLINNLDNNYALVMKADPRTARFGVSAVWNVNSSTDYIRNPTLTISQYNNAPDANGYLLESSLPNSNLDRMTIHVSVFGEYFPGMWAQNSTANGAGTYYYDYGPTGQQTGVVRPGDDFFTGASGLTSTSGVTGTINIYQASDARPVILNRPFRSVGELGYVFRDMPMKSMDFCSSSSVDAALLDFFTVDAAQTNLVANKVDLNTRQAPVLQSILNGSFRVGDPSGAVALNSSVAKTIAGNIVAVTAAAAGSATGPNSTGPLMNKAELVTRLGASPNLPNTTSTIFDDKTGASAYPSIKTQREAPIRALADVMNSRTWNLMIDVVAQTGQFPATAGNLNQFVVTGERRYWLHVAIDRYTGKIVDEQLEPVYE